LRNKTLVSKIHQMAARPLGFEEWCNLCQAFIPFLLVCVVNQSIDP
jgi:hypothetical protein